MRVWQRFVALPGAAVDGVVGIASEHAIHGLIGVVRRRRPRRILELGGGIGTLTFAMLEEVKRLGLDREPGYGLYTIENQPFCKSQLEANLAGFEGLFRRFDSTDELPPGQLFDLIVVDGGGDLPNDMGVMSFAGRMARGGVILIEGGRQFQRNLISEWYRGRSFAYAAIAAPRRTIVARHSGAVARNKSYHLFLFEPGPARRLGLEAKALAYRVWARFARRGGR